MSGFMAPPKSPGIKPAVCPFCRSQNLSTNSKNITDATYWRCTTCGQIWNQLRLLARVHR